MNKKSVSLLSINALYRHRRYEDAINAVSLLQRRGYVTDYTVVGRVIDQGYYQELIELAESLDISESVTFVGEVPEEKLLDYYHEHDVFIFVNHLQTWGLAVFEAMATGLPVIVSKSAGASEVLTDNQNAKLVEPKRPDLIVEAISELVDNPTELQFLSKNGRQFVEENISWSAYARSMLEVFVDSLQEKGVS